MVKVGVVGLGSMGQNHARIYHEMGCLRFVADVDSNRAHDFGHRYGVEYSYDYRDFLPMADAVSIVVPTSLHYSVAMDFLSAGVHCLVEKPIALDTWQAEKMIDMAEAADAHLAVGHIEHFNPAVVMLKAVIDEGDLGKVLTITTRRVGPYVDRIRDVGVVVDSATHDIGVLCYLLGREPLHVWSKTGQVRAAKEDYANILLDFEEATGSIEVNWFNPEKIRTLDVTGTAGTAHLDYIGQTLTVRGKNVNVVRVEPLKLELQDFIDSVEQKRQPRVSGKQGLDILRIALSACKTEVLDSASLRSRGNPS